MTDREKLEAIRTEIERFRKTNKVSEDKEYAQYELDVKCGYDMALDDMLSYINSLSEEPVSEDLEEAAIDICSKVLKGETIIIDGYEYVVLSDAEECFKAGAKWKQEEMMAKAVDGYVIEDIEEGNGDFLLSAEYLPKSMGLKDRQKVKVIVIKKN